MATRSEEIALHRQLLSESLKGLFGAFDNEMLDALLALVEWQEVPSGAIVVHEGEATDDLYCIVSGRLRAFVGSGATRRFLSEMGRGETMGEVAFFTGGRRSASVVAVRDSLVVRLTRVQLEQVLARFPQMLMNMARLIADRLARAHLRRASTRRPTNVCLWPITTLPHAFSTEALAGRLVQECTLPAGAIALTAARAASLVDLPISTLGDPAHARRLTRLLDELETCHAQVIYVPEADLESPWSLRCLRMADQVLLLADATKSPIPDEFEHRRFRVDPLISHAECSLVLLHGDGAHNPVGTAAWLAPRELSGHLHLRTGKREDYARLARKLAGTGIGLVFGDGGARCFAQLGAYRALEEAGIAIDYVGGSSFGAVMAALVALDRPADELIAHARTAFRVNPTGDISLLPMLSLIRGRNMRDTLGLLFGGLASDQADIADTWKTFFCVAGNYSHPGEVVRLRGPLTTNLRASCATPGLLPPVPMDGEFMVDGAAFNGFPVDAMAHLGAGTIYGVTLARDLSPKCETAELPSGWRLLVDKFAGHRRKFRLPSLMQMMMNSATLASAARLEQARQACDVSLEIHLHGVDLLDWHKFDHAVEAGYRRMREQLAATP